jgi:uncharacterized membrane protein YfcA
VREAEESELDWWYVYLAIGAVVGFLAGLLGIGGGMVTVPVLVFVFSAKGLAPEHLMHISLATAMATIAFTSISSVRAHHLHGSVDWRVARIMAPGILAGAFGASLIAGTIPTWPLAAIFTALLFYAAVQMLIEIKPSAARSLPGPAGMFAAGGAIGAVSSLLAAGGAFLTIPFLTWCRVPVRRAIGTAAANGFPIAVAGTAGYVVQGMRVQGLPAGSLGFVYLPALVLIVGVSVFTAPLGARVAHRLPVKRLRGVFAFVMFLLGVRMLIGLWK